MVTAVSSSVNSVSPVFPVYCLLCRTIGSVGISTNNMRDVYDIVIITENLKDLERIMNKMTFFCEEYGQCLQRVKNLKYVINEKDLLQ